MGDETLLRDVERTEQIWWDDYVGTKDALVFVGVIRRGQFPGEGDNNKQTLRLWKGSVARAHAGVPRLPGRADVSRVSQNRFRVSVYIDKATGARRLAAWHARGRREACGFRSTHGDAFMNFVDRVLAPGPITTRANNLFDFGRAEMMHPYVLHSLDNSENDYLSVLEWSPHRRDDRAELRREWLVSAARAVRAMGEPPSAEAG